MKRIAFAIEKGGTAKTTSAVHVANALARAGSNVLLVDTDTQDQCASHLGIKQFGPGLAEIILGEARPREAIVQARERLFLLPAGDKLAGVKFRLASIARRAGVEPQGLLAAALSFTGAGRLDYLILDTAPGNDAFLINVLLYADVIVVPVLLEIQAVRGMMRFFRTLSLLGREPDLILPTIHDPRVARTRRIMAKLQERFPDKLLEKISYSARVSEAAGAGLTIHEYWPRSPVAAEYDRVALALSRHAARPGARHIDGGVNACQAQAG